MSKESQNDCSETTSKKKTKSKMRSLANTFVEEIKKVNLIQDALREKVMVECVEPMQPMLKQWPVIQQILASTKIENGKVMIENGFGQSDMEGVQDDIKKLKEAIQSCKKNISQNHKLNQKQTLRVSKVADSALSKVDLLMMDSLVANRALMNEIFYQNLSRYDKTIDKRIKQLTEIVANMKQPLQLLMQDMKAEVEGMSRQNHKLLTENRHIMSAEKKKDKNFDMKEQLNTPERCNTAFRSISLLQKGQNEPMIKLKSREKEKCKSTLQAKQIEL